MADPNEQAKSDEASEPGSSAGSDPPDREKAPTRDTRDRNQRIREEAAAKRRTKREAEARRAAPARNLDATEIVDDALVRTTHNVGNWLKKHFNVVQWVIVLGVVGGLGYQIYRYRADLARDRAAEEITRALKAERGRVGAQENPGPDRYTGLSDLRQEFPTEEARLKAAEAEYRKAESSTSGPTSSIATLGLAGVLYDQGKYQEAQAAYEKVKDSELAKRDRDARGRAIEGIGLSLEAQGKKDAALQAFRELGNSDIPGLNDLGQYHQARALVAAGERDKAKDILKKLLEKLGKAEEKDRSMGTGFLENQARELLATVDPSALPKPAAGGLTPEQLERLKAQLNVQGGGKLDPSKLEEVLRQLSASSGAPAPGPAPESSAVPAPAAPAGSAP